MRQDGRRFYSYFIAILFILGVVLVCNVLLQKDKEDYSRAEFLKDMEAGRVTAVEIQLNSETPTGALFIDLKNGGQAVQTLRSRMDDLYAEFRLKWPKDAEFRWAAVTGKMVDDT